MKKSWKDKNTLIIDFENSVGICEHCYQKCSQKQIYCDNCLVGEEDDDNE